MGKFCILLFCCGLVPSGIHLSVWSLLLMSFDKVQGLDKISFNL